MVNGGNVSGAAVANGSKQRRGGGQGLRRTAAGGGFLRDVFSENTFTCFLCPRCTIKSVQLLFSAKAYNNISIKLNDVNKECSMFNGKTL